MNSKQYRIFERVRVAILLAFISGFVDAYTFMTQGQRFAVEAHRHRLDAHFGAGAYNAHRDFPPVGDQYFLDHYNLPACILFDKTPEKS